MQKYGVRIIQIPMDINWGISVSNKRGVQGVIILSFFPL